MAASCDIVLASSAAEFSAPGSRRGRFCHTPGVGLAERVGPSRALGAPPPPPSTATQRNTLTSPRAEMLLLGEKWTADQAHVYGLVTKVFEPDALLAGAQQVAESLSVGVSSAAIVVSALLCGALPSRASHPLLLAARQTLLPRAPEVSRPRGEVLMC